MDTSRNSHEAFNQSDACLYSPLRLETGVVDDLIDNRKLKHQQQMNPTSCSPLTQQSKQQKVNRIRQLNREKRIASRRPDMELFVMKQEHASYQQWLQQEAQKHSIPPEDIDRLVEEAQLLQDSSTSTQTHISDSTTHFPFTDTNTQIEQEQEQEQDDLDDDELIQLLHV